MSNSQTQFELISAVLHGSGGVWLVMAVLSLAGLCIGVLILARVHRRQGAGFWQRLRDARESGVATIEFVLVFPIMLFLMLLLVQSTLAMVGNTVVHYAAFAATRAAIVQVPADYGDVLEPSNTIVTAPGHEKFDRIRAAAVFALMPVSGRLDSSDYPADAFRDGIEELFASQGRTPPNWVDNLAAQRLHYAAENTEITLLEAQVWGQAVDFEEISDTHRFGPRDAITVRVDHRFNLSVPYVRPVFADAEHDTADGEGAYANVVAQYTLTNEGIRTGLPPTPVLPRQP